MASIKNLKKDIDYILSLALNDCFYVIEQNKYVDEEKALQIAQSVLIKHKELRKKVNQTNSLNSKSLKEYYDGLIKEMLEFTNDALERLSKLVKETV